MPSVFYSRLRSAIQGVSKRSLTARESGIQSSAQVLFGQGKLLFGNSRLFHSAANFTFFLQNGIAFAVRSDSGVNQRRNLSVFGALSRTFSIPSVSGPSFQVCGYHVDCFLSKSSPESAIHKAPMCSCGANQVLGKFYVEDLPHSRLKVAANHSVKFSTTNGFSSCQKARLSLIDEDNPNYCPFYGRLTHGLNKGSGNCELCLRYGGKGFHSLSFSSVSAGTARVVSFDNSVQEQLANPAASSEQQNLVGKFLNLVSGSCYLPHPDKQETGGEDAHFICDGESAIGVADGVGGWADHGIDSGLFARELMSNSVNAVQQEPKGSVDPARVLEKAHSSTKARGSSTACIIALTDKGLHAVNLGDSGFMVVRDGSTVFRSPAQQHDFNFTYQLESGNTGDLPSSGQVFSIHVAPGDIIIAGTDGLFDNLYNNEITAVVVHSKRVGLGPQVTAQKIAALARQRAQDKNRQTPFSTAAQDAGIRYYGGKLDDITVVVSYITSSNNGSHSSA